MALLESTTLAYGNYVDNTTSYDNSTNRTHCEGGAITIEKDFVNIAVFPALLIVFCISFFQRRKAICTSCCAGRPAVAYPVNFIDEFERRWAYAAAFGIVTYKIMLLFDGKYYYAPKQFNDPRWMEQFGFVKVFIQIINVLQVGLVFYPLFACIVFRRNIIANIIGFVYAAAWLGISMLSILICLVENIASEYVMWEGSFALDAAFYVPVVVCYLILIICYIIDFVINVRNLCTNRTKTGDVFGSKNEEKDTTPSLYVRMLLQREKRQKNQKMVAKLKHKMKYANVPGLKYSPRVLCTMVVAGFALFKAAVEFGYYIDVLMKLLISLGDAMGKPLLEEVGGNDMNVVFDRIMEGLFIVRVGLIVCNAVSVLIQVIFMIIMVLNYRRHIRKYILGHRSWHYKCNQSPSSALVGAMRYSGYQVAFIFYGWLILMFFLFLVICVIAFLVALPLRDGYSTIVISKFKSIWPTLIISFAIMITQRLAARFAFLQDKGEHMALNNRRVFHVLSYFLFFFNVLLGLFGALKRILISMVAGIIFLGRLDRTLMMQGLERFDSGFNAYLGMLEMELYHNHPIIRYFIECLQEGAKARREREEKRMTLNEEDIGILEMKHRRQILRNKWHKAITLINNPLILVERLNTLVKQQNDDGDTQKEMVQVLDQAHQLIGSSSAPSGKITSLYHPSSIPDLPSYVPYVPDDMDNSMELTNGKDLSMSTSSDSGRLYPPVNLGHQVQYMNTGYMEGDQADTKL